MLREEKVKISKTSEFWILPYTQNRKLQNLGNFSFTSIFDNFCNLRFRNDKNELRQKLKGQDVFLEEKKKTSEVSKFLILPYVQNRKLRNLGNFSFTSNFDSFREILRESESLVFFVTFNFISYLSWKSYWSSSSCSEDVKILSFHINLFIKISCFLTFPCYKEINDVTYNHS